MPSPTCFLAALAAFFGSNLSAAVTLFSFPSWSEDGHDERRLLKSVFCTLARHFTHIFAIPSSLKPLGDGLNAFGRIHEVFPPRTSSTSDAIERSRFFPLSVPRREIRRNCFSTTPQAKWAQTPFLSVLTALPEFTYTKISPSPKKPSPLGRETEGGAKTLLPKLSFQQPTAVTKFQTVSFNRPYALAFSCYGDVACAW